MVGGYYVVIYCDLELIGNVGYFIGEGFGMILYYFGDELDEILCGVDVLVCLVYVLWVVMKEIVDFVRLVGVWYGFFIYEGLFNEWGW